MPNFKVRNVFVGSRVPITLNTRLIDQVRWMPSSDVERFRLLAANGARANPTTGLSVESYPDTFTDPTTAFSAVLEGEDYQFSLDMYLRINSSQVLDQAAFTKVFPGESVARDASRGVTRNRYQDWLGIQGVEKRNYPLQIEFIDSSNDSTFHLFYLHSIVPEVPIIYYDPRGRDGYAVDTGIPRGTNFVKVTLNLIAAAVPPTIVAASDIGDISVVETPGRVDQDGVAQLDVPEPYRILSTTTERFSLPTTMEIDAFRVDNAVDSIEGDRLTNATETLAGAVPITGDTDAIFALGSFVMNGQPFRQLL